MAKVKVNKEKELPPVTVTSKSDPKLKAYQDSLRLYNAYEAQSKLMGGGKKITSNKVSSESFTTKQLQNRRKNINLFDKKGKPYLDEKGKPVIFSEDYKNEKEYKARPNDKKLIKKYKELGFTDKDIMYHTSPDVVSDKIRPIAEYFDGTAISPVYKKPVQPIIYKEKTVEEKPFHEKVNEIDSKIKTADVKPEYKGGMKGESVYHPNGDLMGFMFGNKFYKNKNQEGIKSATKTFLLDDSNIDNLLKLKLGDYYGGQIRDANVDEKQGLLIK